MAEGLCVLDSLSDGGLKETRRADGVWNADIEFNAFVLASMRMAEMPISIARRDSAHDGLIIYLTCRLVIPPDLVRRRGEVSTGWQRSDAKQSMIGPRIHDDRLDSCSSTNHVNRCPLHLLDHLF